MINAFEPLLTYRIIQYTHTLKPTHTSAHTHTYIL